MTPPRDSACYLRAAWRVPAIILWLGLCFPVVLFAWAAGMDGLRGRTSQRFYAGVGRIVGLRMSVAGGLDAARPLMLVANHTSYLDVLVLGALTPLSFTPKKEVRSWPIIGFLCVLGDCVFVERKPSEMHEAKSEMEKRLSKGKVVCLFPEGTTSDGKHMKPFKSGFFSLAEQHTLPVEPITIAYTHIGDTPVSAERREEVAWVGDASFFMHFLHVMALPYLRVHVVRHPVQQFASFADRKALAKACEKIIGASLAHELELVHAG